MLLFIFRLLFLADEKQQKNAAQSPHILPILYHIVV
nr:MAG TPA: hypothetical protein [Caudoviricetes sp.]